MSLINKMLRNLDQRRVNQDIFKELPSAVSSAAHAKHNSSLPTGMILRLSVLAIAGLAGWWVLNQVGTPTGIPGLNPTAGPIAQPPRPMPPPAPAQAETPQPAAVSSPATLVPAQPSTQAVAPPSAPATTPATLAPVVAAEKPAKTPLVAEREKPPPRERRHSAEKDTAAPASTAKPASQTATPSSSSPAPTSEAVGIQKTAIPASARERADADIRRAQAYINAGQTSEATELLRTALSSDPTYPTPRQLLFKLLVDGKKTDAAISLLQDGLELLPQQLSWSISIARLQVDRKDYSSAEKTLAKASAYAVKSADYFGFYGHVQQKLGDHKKAIDTYQSAIRINPAEGRWWMGLASALEAEKRIPEAKEAYRQALETGALSEGLTNLAEKKIASN